METPTPWTSRPEVRELLASCAVNPPRKRTRTFRFQETDRVYVGQRVCALRLFYQASEPPIDTPAWLEWLKFNEQVAVAQAIANAPMMEAAE